MKTLVTLIAGLLFFVSAANAEETKLPPLPENIQILLKTDATLLDLVLDLSFAPALASAKLYFRTNDEAGTAFWIQVLVKVVAGVVTLPNDFDESTILGVRQVKAGGIKEEWINEPLLERFAEKLMKEPRKEKTKIQL